MLIDLDDPRVRKIIYDALGDTPTHPMNTERDVDAILAGLRNKFDNDKTMPHPSTMDGPNRESLKPNRTPISELFNHCGRVNVYEGDVTFWANAVRNHAIRLHDATEALKTVMEKLVATGDPK